MSDLDDTLDLTEALAALREQGTVCDTAVCRAHAPHIERLARGSGTLTRRLFAANSPQALVGRVLAGSGGGFALAMHLHEAPLLVPIGAAVWCVTAWKAGAPQPPKPLSYVEARAILVITLRGWMDGRKGLFLSELHDRLVERPALARMTREDVRTVLDHYRIPVRPQVRSGDAGGRMGIHVDDLSPLGEVEPLSEAVEPLTCDVATQHARVEGA